MTRGPGPDRPGEPELSPMQAAVRRTLTATAPGEVVTYGELAEEAGFPGAARAVGSYLRDHGAPLPWWRVVTSSGRLAPGHEAEQARRLLAEGVAVTGNRVVLGRR